MKVQRQRFTMLECLFLLRAYLLSLPPGSLDAEPFCVACARSGALECTSAPQAATMDPHSLFRTGQRSNLLLPAQEGRHHPFLVVPSSFRVALYDSARVFQLLRELNCVAIMVRGV